MSPFKLFFFVITLVLLSSSVLALSNSSLGNVKVTGIFNVSGLTKHYSDIQMNSKSIVSIADTNASKVTANIISAKNLSGNLSYSFVKGYPNCAVDTFTTGWGVCTSVNQSKLNVNRSNYWDNLNTPSDLNYKIVSYWQNITGRVTHVLNLTDNIVYSTKNVNRSTYWDGIDTPAGLNYKVLSYWANVSDRPSITNNSKYLCCDSDCNMTGGVTITNGLITALGACS